MFADSHFVVLFNTHENHSSKQILLLVFLCLFPFSFIFEIYTWNYMAFMWFKGNEAMCVCLFQYELVCLHMLVNLPFFLIV